MPKDKGEVLKRSVQLAALKAGEYPAGTQIMYVPSHAKPYDSFCAYGFIMGYTEREERKGFVRFVFCRFFNDNNPDSTKGWENLRTIANSEACKPWDLHLHNSRPQEIVDGCVDHIRREYKHGRTGR